MTQNSTHEILILQTYAETTYAETEWLAAKLESEPNVRHELSALIETKKQLNAKLLSPSATSLQIIMAHSRKTEPAQAL